MLKSVQIRKASASGARFAIVASKYNRKYVDSMLRAARRTLLEAGAASVEVVRVPGAFEIPVVAAALAVRDGGRLGAILCLGVILRGATTHAQHIGEAVTDALSRVQVDFQVPTVHEVLLLENEEQARQRCLEPRRNRGVEAALTAIEMADVMRRLRSRSKQAGA
jgi:6,7-dimethyl-8-ribityllumazine synthase